MIYTNVNGLPEAIVQAVVNDDYDSGESDVSCTTLIDSPRIRILKREHDDVLIKDVSECLPALFGTAIHYVLERSATPNELAEERLYVDIDGIKIGAQIDNLGLNNGSLRDYKFTGIYAALNPKKSWDQQLNVQAYILSENGYHVDNLGIVVLCKDHSLAKARRERNYPPAGIMPVPVELWSKDEQYAYIKERVRIHKEADINLPLCTDEERWAKGGKYAVMKPGGKRALRLLDSVEEAEVFIAESQFDNLTYHKRPFEYPRCEQWCDCNTVCEQWLMGG